MCDIIQNKRPKLLLHSCCGPCSTAVIERLNPRFSLTVFFFNPNITEEEEYQRRLKTQIAFLERYNDNVKEADCVQFLHGSYDPPCFFQGVLGLESEPEGGARCTQCFRLRLTETARKAKDLGFDYFSTTLSVSPHKDYPRIAALGDTIGTKQGVPFLAEDFKKKAGYQRSITLSKEYQLYRQNYCGCSFSKWESS